MFLEAEAGQTLAVQLLLEVRRALLRHKRALPSNSKMIKNMSSERGRHIANLDAAGRTLITLPQIKLNRLEDLGPGSPSRAAHVYQLKHRAAGATTVGPWRVVARGNQS